jgi:hypothetical protein
LNAAIDAKYQRIMRWNECLARLPDGPCRMAEIGVWAGGTCSRILAARQDVQMVLVDPWRAADPGSSYAKSGSLNASRDHERQYLRCMRRLRRHRGRITVHRMVSTEAAKRVPVASLDLVFIDGDHSYDGLIGDWRAWNPLVGRGGLVCLHDSRSTPERPIDDAGSVRATREVISRDAAFELVDEVDSLTILRRR